MSVTLMFRNDAIDTTENNAKNWAVIKAAAANDDGMVTIDDDTVRSIGRLLTGVVLANGETVTVFSCGEDDDSRYDAQIPAFGPALLPIQVQDQVRDRLARTENGKTAVRLFNEMIRLGLQVGFSGKTHIPAYMKGVNWTADEVEIRRSSTGMTSMLVAIGVDAEKDEEGYGEVTFEAFAKAVNDNGRYVDAGDRLNRFVDCARRQGATHVYWA